VYRILYTTAHIGEIIMKTVTLTDFRSHASGMFSEVEKGETLLVMRHGRPIAEIFPVGNEKSGQPSWKRPGLRLSTKGVSLSEIILAERNRESVS
jgi:antitoxin (DNA-binding transcriptional repressor) of toxin-antitoxin stability system